MVVFPAEPTARLSSSTKISCSSSRTLGPPQILYAHRLALRSRHFTGALEHDVASHADHRLEMAAQSGCGLAGQGPIGRRRRGELDFNRHRVHRSFAREHDLIMRGKPRESDQKG